MSETPKNTELGKSVWQSQALDAPRVTVEFVRHHIDKLNADFRRELRLMYVSIGLIVIVLLTTLSETGDWARVSRIGIILTILGAGYLLTQMRRRANELKSQGESGIMQTLEAYRAELQRRRDYYLDSWRWSVWPMLPALLALLGGGAIYDRERGAMHYLMMILLCIVLLVIAVWDHRRKGRVYQRELDAFETLVK